jgi:hypothetical protein
MAVRRSGVVVADWWRGPQPVHDAGSHAIRGRSRPAGLCRRAAPLRPPATPGRRFGPALQLKRCHSRFESERSPNVRSRPGGGGDLRVAATVFQ